MGRAFCRWLRCTDPTLAASPTYSKLLTTFVRLWPDRSDCCQLALMRQRAIVLRYPVVRRSSSMMCLLLSLPSSSSTTARASMSTVMPCPCMPTRSCPRDCGGANWELRVRQCCSSARVLRSSSVPRCANLLRLRDSTRVCRTCRSSVSTLTRR